MRNTHNRKRKCHSNGELISDLVMYLFSQGNVHIKDEYLDGYFIHDWIFPESNNIRLRFCKTK